MENENDWLRKARDLAERAVQFDRQKQAQGAAYYYKVRLDRFNEVWYG